LLLKPCPNFDSAALHQFSKYNIFLEAHSFYLIKIKEILDTPGLKKKKLILMYNETDTDVI
jgi:hypothetical protein